MIIGPPPKFHGTRDNLQFRGAFSRSHTHPGPSPIGGSRLRAAGRPPAPVRGMTAFKGATLAAVTTWRWRESNRAGSVWMRWARALTCGDVGVVAVSAGPVSRFC